MRRLAAHLESVGEFSDSDGLKKIGETFRRINSDSSTLARYSTMATAAYAKMRVEVDAINKQLRAGTLEEAERNKLLSQRERLLKEQAGIQGKIERERRGALRANMLGRLAGGAFVLTQAGQTMQQFGTELQDIAERSAEANATTSQLVGELARSVPILGDMVKGFDEMGEGARQIAAEWFRARGASSEWIRDQFGITASELKAIQKDNARIDKILQEDRERKANVAKMIADAAEAQKTELERLATKFKEPMAAANKLLKDASKKELADLQAAGIDPRAKVVEQYEKEWTSLEAKYRTEREKLEQEATDRVTAARVEALQRAGRTADAAILRLRSEFEKEAKEIDTALDELKKRTDLGREEIDARVQLLQQQRQALEAATQQSVRFAQEDGAKQRRERDAATDEKIEAARRQRAIDALERAGQEADRMAKKSNAADRSRFENAERLAKLQIEQLKIRDEFEQRARALKQIEDDQVNTEAQRNAALRERLALQGELNAALEAAAKASKDSADEAQREASRRMIDALRGGPGTVEGNRFGARAESMKDAFSRAADMAKVGGEPTFPAAIFGASKGSLFSKNDAKPLSDVAGHTKDTAEAAKQLLAQQQKANDFLQQLLFELRTAEPIL